MKSFKDSKLPIPNRYRVNLKQRIPRSHINPAWLESEYGQASLRRGLIGEDGEAPVNSQEDAGIEAANEDGEENGFEEGGEGAEFNFDASQFDEY